MNQRVDKFAGPVSKFVRLPRFKKQTNSQDQTELASDFHCTSCTLSMHTSAASFYTLLFETV